MHQCTSFVGGAPSRASCNADTTIERVCCWGAVSSHVYVYMRGRLEAGTAPDLAFRHSIQAAECVGCAYSGMGRRASSRRGTTRRQTGVAPNERLHFTRPHLQSAAGVHATRNAAR